MAPWLAWCALAIALLFADLLIFGGASGVLMALAVMSAVGMGAALAGLAPAVQLLAAAASSVVVVPVMLYLFRRSTAASASTGHDDPRLRDEVVTVEVRGASTGITLLGDFYPARYTDGSTPAPDTRVAVTGFRGITAMVRPVEPTATSREERA